MRSRFRHFLPPPREEITSIWEKGFLTVDANVLLDLYRVHHQTREALLNALADFRGRLWLSHQAALEFFRNRNSVILSAASEFEKAHRVLSELRKSTETAADRLRGIRAIPVRVVDDLQSNALQPLDAADRAVQEATTQHPDFLSADPVLESVLELFEGAVGPEPEADEFEQLQREAKRRIKEKIPPGYLDAAKDGDRSIGDYLVWSQILKRSAEVSLPVILVTSERKEDWWEKLRGKRFRLRHELVEEAARVAGQRVLPYHTDRFLEHAASRAGETVAPNVLLDIRSVAGRRASESSGHERNLEELAERVLQPFSDHLTDGDDTITSLIAETNASGFYADNIEIIEAGPLDLEEVRFPFTAHVHFSGDASTDHVFCGDRITAEVTGIIAFEGSSWEVVEYSLAATVEDWLG